MLTNPQAIATSADQTAWPDRVLAEVCARVGADASEARLIKFTNNAVFARPSSELVVRIAGSPRSVRFPQGARLSTAPAWGRRTGERPDLRPIRGQHVVVTNPGVTDFFSEDTGLSEDLLCIYPQGDVVVLGGTALDGVADTTPHPDAAARILERCAAVAPQLRSAKVLEHRIGLRPTRPAIRLEMEHVGDNQVAHNYGHGGAGVTLSWGCAEGVQRLIEQR